MKYLFNRRGQHIANLVNNQLHNPSGKNVGHYLPEKGIFIDMRGSYLGEIVHDDRLLVNQSSTYKNVNFGVFGNYGNAGSYGNPGSHGNIGVVSCFDDVEPSRLNG